MTAFVARTVGTVASAAQVDIGKTTYTLAEMKTARVALHQLACLAVQLSNKPNISTINSTQYLRVDIIDPPPHTHLYELLPIQRRVEALMTQALKRSAAKHEELFIDYDVFNLYGFQHRAGMGYVGTDVDITNNKFPRLGDIILAACLDVEGMAQVTYGETLAKLPYARVLNFGS